MKVKDLIETLSTLHPETLVVLSRDSEGNSYSPMSQSYSLECYRAENSWRGDIDVEDSVPCVVLYPVN